MLYFFAKGQRIIAVHGIRNKAREISRLDLKVAVERKRGLVGKGTIMRRRTNFDVYLEKRLKDPDFKEKFRKAGEAWDVAIQIASLRKESGLSQKELARRIGTSQQQISRLESPSYEGHSLSMLRRVAEALEARVYIQIKQKDDRTMPVVAEPETNYRTKRRRIA